MDPWLQLLYRAMVAEYGIAVKHEDPAVARATFQAKARASEDEALRRLSYTIRPEHPKTLWILKPRADPPGLSNGGDPAPQS